MRHPISIQQKTRIRDEIGAWQESWSEVVSCRAAIWSISASESAASNRLDYTTTHKIRIRYLPSLTPDMRVVFGRRVFEIASIININEGGRLIDLICRETV